MPKKAQTLKQLRKTLRLFLADGVPTSASDGSSSVADTDGLYPKELLDQAITASVLAVLAKKMEKRDELRWGFLDFTYPLNTRTVTFATAKLVDAEYIQAIREVDSTGRHRPIHKVDDAMQAPSGILTPAYDPTRAGGDGVSPYKFFMEDERSFGLIGPPVTTVNLYIKFKRLWTGFGTEDEVVPPGIDLKDTFAIVFRARQMVRSSTPEEEVSPEASRDNRSILKSLDDDHHADETVRGESTTVNYVGDTA